MLIENIKSKRFIFTYLGVCLFGIILKAEMRTGVTGISK